MLLVTLENCSGQDEETNQALSSTFGVGAFLVTVQHVPKKPLGIFLDHALFSACKAFRATITDFAYE